MKKLTCLITGVLYCAWVTVPALAAPSVIGLSQTFHVITYPPDPDGAMPVPSLTVDVQFAWNNPDPTPSYFYTNQKLRAVPNQLVKPSGIWNRTYEFGAYPNKGDFRTIHFDQGPVFNNWTYTADCVVTGTKTETPTPVDPPPAVLATDTKTETISWM